jgi:RHS repeat-associated protein
VPGYSAAWNYDKAGNIKTYTENGVTWTRGYDTRNRLTNELSGTTEIHWEYDAQGNQTLEKFYQDGVLKEQRKRTFDYWNAVSEFELKGLNSSGALELMQYQIYYFTGNHQSFGSRKIFPVGGSSNPRHPVWSADGATLQDYQANLAGDSSEVSWQPLSSSILTPTGQAMGHHVDNGNVTSFYVSNGIGSVGRVINQNGVVEQDELATPWGKPLTSNGTVVCKYGFAGETRLLEAETIFGGGEVAMGDRTYSWRQMRFVQSDPTGDNAYAYAGNNPVGMTHAGGGPLSSVFTEPWNRPSKAWMHVFGGLQVVGGVVETAIGIGLSKTGIGAVLGVPLVLHGLDTVSAGLVQTVSGQPTNTWTYQGAHDAARALGASEKTADWIGMGADFAPALLALRVPGGAVSRLSAAASLGGRALAEIGTFVGTQMALSAAFGGGDDDEEFGNCFVAGTQVETIHGPKNIEEIEAGDWVLSRSDASGEQGWQPVMRTFVRHPEELLALSITANGSTSEITTTPGHPFWSVDRNAWVKAGELKLGERLSLADRGTATVAATEVLQKPFRSAFTTYNFEVAGWHSYFVALEGARESVWVHNTSVAVLKAIRRHAERLVKGKVRTSGFSAQTQRHVRRAQQALAQGDQALAGTHMHSLVARFARGAKARGHLRDVVINRRAYTGIKRFRIPDYRVTGTPHMVLDLKPFKPTPVAYNTTPQFMDLRAAGMTPVPLYYRLR